ncbi:tyrosine--tRNA ligase [Candidatus Saccharibacteria bacterium]|nr:tyrosine--tRNA ligase [Candidatus Saccharibacteria bacterium]
MSLSDDLAWRGLIKDKTFDSNKWLDTPKAFYWGVDCSSDSLTIGNLAPLMLARRLADAGWKPILLVGGATSLIGDPGGKDEERPLLSRETVQHNVDAIKQQVARLFGGKQFTPADNYEWFKDVGYLEFLRDIGKHFSVTELMQRDFVAERIGEDGTGISYAEFSYSLIQGYDYWKLYSQHKTELQIGGSDQWGNMLSGVSLIRKKESKEVHALSMPLVVNKATGKKFGKSEEGAVWLDTKKTSPFKFYQFWYNSSDKDAPDYLKIFTLLSKDKISELSESSQDSAQRIAQKTLAYEVTAIVHGKDQADRQKNISQALFGEAGIDTLSNDEIKEIKGEIPNLTVQPGTPTIEAIVKTSLASSNSEARRLSQSKAIYVNNQQFSNDHLEAGDFKNGRLMIRRGKAYKDSALIELG